jgi:hypothetical protein
LVIDTFTNRVGIGNTNPSVPLDVSGDTFIGSNGRLFVTSTTTSTNIIASSNNGSFGTIECTQSSNISNKQPLVLNAYGGNVGVGLTNPSSTLDVSGIFAVRGNGANNQFIGENHVYLQFFPYGFNAGRKAYVGYPTANNTTFTIQNDASNIEIKTSTNNSINLINNSTNTLTAVNGRIGIGLTNPSVALDVSGSVNVSNSITIGSNSAIQRMFLETAKATTSGSTVEFTGIPSWSRKITIMFNNLSPTNSDNLLIQLGTSSSYETTGYFCSSTRCAGSVSTVTYSNSFGIQLASGNDNLCGNLILTTVSTNTWIASWTIGSSMTALTYFGGGSKTINSTLTRIQIALTTPTFDGGSVNILIEGY